MKNTHINRLVSFISLVSWLGILAFNVLASEYSFRNLTVADGLSNNSVKAIYQDSLGFLWLGTKNGLNRFDGYEFKTYFNRNDEFAGQSNDLVIITPDASGNMWIGTFNGIVLFNPYFGTFRNLSAIYQGELPRGVVVGIWIENENSIWVGTKNGLYWLKDGKSVCIESLRGKYINSMFSDKHHLLLIDVVQYGLVQFDIKTHTITPYAEDVLKRPILSKIFQDSKNRIWGMADLDHIFQIDTQLHKLQKIDISPVKIGYKHAQIHDLLEYNDSTLFLATDNGLYVLNTGHSFFIQSPLDIIPYEMTGLNRQMTLFKDRQGSLWVGTFSDGVLQFNSGNINFRSYKLAAEEGKAKTPSRVVGHLVEYQNRIWVGCNSGMFFIDLQTGILHRMNLEEQIRGLDADSELYYVYRLSDNQILFYLLNHGTFCLNLDTYKVTSFDIDLPETSQIRAIARDTDGKLWIAQDELSLFDMVEKKNSVDLSTNYDGITQFMYTQDIIPYKNGMLVGTRTKGVIYFPRNEKNELKYFKGEFWGGEELKNKNVSVLYEDTDANIWIGTYDSGLYFYNRRSDKVSHFSERNYLVNNTICDIVQDKYTGSVWVATLTGISRITPQKKILNYTSKNGFPMNELSAHSFLEASNGNIFVGGKDAVVELLLDNLEKVSKTDLRVCISQVKTLNSLTDDDHILLTAPESLNNIELNYGNSSVQIKFSSMDYIYPEGVKYAYRLKGLEEEWNYINRNEAVYTNLPDGVYTFQVKACGSDGVWGNAVTGVSLRVRPPLLLTVWAKLFYTLCVLALVYFVFRYYYIRKTNKYRLKIKEIEKENIERNYKMKLELFTNFSHELRTPLSLIKSPSEELLHDEELPQKFIYPVSQICKNSNRLLLLVNQLMDFRKLEHGAMLLNLKNVNMVMFMNECFNSFSELLNNRDISIRYTNDYYGSDWWIDSDLMEKVMFNLLSNAIKHSKNGSVIKVNSIVKDGKFLLSVQDFGEGISPDDLDKIFDPFFQVRQGSVSDMFGSGIGLNLVKYVVSLHHGRIWVESTLGQGSTFFIEMSLGKEQYADDKVIFVNETVVNPALDVEKESIKPLEGPIGLEENSDEEEDEQLLLIAEDDEDLRSYLVNRFKDSYRVLEATDGKIGLELALENLPDIIISDVMMPNMNGVDFCEQVKNNPKTGHIPFVMLTAKVMEKYIEEGYSVLADDYVLKPFSIVVLKAKIRSLLKNRIQLRKYLGKKMATVEVTVSEIAAIDPFMEKLIGLIKQRAADSELQVSDLYEEMGYGRAQFFRKIKAVSGLSPNKLIIDIRMKMAADMLRENQKTISEVAYQVGFSDPSYFSRVFKSVFQITPKEFQKDLGRDDTLIPD